MATIIPKIEKIKENREKYPQQVLELVEKLQPLDHSYEIYVKPFLFGERPDIVILRRGYGAMIVLGHGFTMEEYCYEPKFINDVQSGKFFVNNDAKLEIANPVSRSVSIKENLFNKYCESLYSMNVFGRLSTGRSIYGEIKSRVYFYNLNEQQLEEARLHTDKYKRIWCKDMDILNDVRWKLNDPFSNFNDAMYEEIRAGLWPVYQKSGDGKPLRLNKEQKKLSASKRNVREQIKGVAGSGKTVVLANRAVNAKARTGGNVLVLTYNITLCNKISDEIAVYAEQMEKDEYEVIHFHRFLLNALSECSLDTKRMARKYLFDEEISEEEEREFVKKLHAYANHLPKYDTILIDEAQDFKCSWMQLVEEVFLEKNGELVLFADEKQNVYQRPLSEEKRIQTHLGSEWKHLNYSYRMGRKIIELATKFQTEYMSAQYVVDQPEYEQLSFINQEQMEYHKMPPVAKSITELCDLMNGMSIFGQVELSKVTIISSKIERLRELEYYARTQYGWEFETTIETKEQFESTKALMERKKEQAKQEELNKIRQNPGFINQYAIMRRLEKIEKEYDDKLNQILEDYRRIKKFKFNANSPKIKIATEKSFKGWESDTLFLLLDEQEKSPESIYVALTRCARHLVIFNLGNKQYDEFFEVEIREAAPAFSIR